MSTDVEGQLKLLYAAVMKNVLKECLSSLHVSESVTSELETRWIQRYESVSSNSLIIDDRTETQEPSAMDSPVGPVFFHCISHS